MGVLESRVLDFDTVIVTSMNEGKFPAEISEFVYPYCDALDICFTFINVLKHLSAL
jgi:hypothetical protein